MRIGCVFFPNFAVQVELKTNNMLAGKPVIVGGFPHELKAVHDASKEAIRLGVKKGMPLRQAYALCPQGIFLPLAEDKYRDAFTHILKLLLHCSPVVEAGNGDCAFLDATWEQDKIRFLKETMERIKRETSLNASAGIASSKFVAQVASQVAKPGECLIVPDGEERKFLQDLPIDFLPASPESLRRLKLFGICKMGDLARLPSQAVNLQFGREGQTLWELANGIDYSRLMACQMPEALTGKVSFEPPAEDFNIILARAADLLNKLGKQLEQRWQCCRRLTICLTFSNGCIAQRTFHFKEATRSQEVMLRHLQSCLERMSAQSPVEEMGLTLTDLCAEEGRQASFLDRPPKHWGKLMTAITQLQRRYGKEVIKMALYKERCLLPEDSLSFAKFDVKSR